MGWNGEKSAWLERKINESEWEKGGVWECWKLGGSFRLGWSYPLIVFPSSSFAVFAWVGNVSGTVVIKTVGAAVNGSSLMVRSICSLSSLLFSLSGITVGKKCIPNFISNTEGRGSSESLVETSLLGICWGGYEIF